MSSIPFFHYTNYTYGTARSRCIFIRASGKVNLCVSESVCEAASSTSERNQSPANSGCSGGATRQRHRRQGRHRRPRRGHGPDHHSTDRSFANGASSSHDRPSGDDHGARGHGRADPGTDLASADDHDHSAPNNDDHCSSDHDNHRAADHDNHRTADHDNHRAADHDNYCAADHDNHRSSDHHADCATDTASTTLRSNAVSKKTTGSPKRQCAF